MSAFETKYKVQRYFFIILPIMYVCLHIAHLNLGFSLEKTQKCGLNKNKSTSKLNSESIPSPLFEHRELYPNSKTLQSFC